MLGSHEGRSETVRWWWNAEIIIIEMKTWPLTSQHHCYGITSHSDPTSPSLNSPGFFLDFRSPAGPACCSRTESACTSDGNLERIEEFGWQTGSVTGRAVGESLKYQHTYFTSVTSEHWAVSRGHLDLGSLALKVRTDNRMNSWSGSDQGSSGLFLSRNLKSI